MSVDTFQLQPAQLENELIKLIPLQQDDAERLYTVAADPMIWAGHPQKDRYKKEEFSKYFNSAIVEKNGLLVFAKNNDELIGCTRFYAYQPAMSSIAIGYTFLACKYWGGQYNKSLKKLMLDYAFSYVDVVLFHIGATNLRSQKAVGKIGAVKSRELDMDFNGTKQPYYEYEINKTSYKSFEL